MEKKLNSKLSVELNKIIDKSKNIVLTTHLIPDGDALGSELSFYEYLKQKGKNATLINHSYTPDNYKWMDKKGLIKVYRTDKDKYDKIIAKADLIVILDTNEFARTKSMETSLRKSTAKKIVIDHHLGLDKKPFDFAISDVDQPATSQLLYELFLCEDEKIINKKIAEYLYVGIMTDTGSFRYPRTTAKTFFICADLINRGADPVHIFEFTYNNLNPGKIKLLGRFIDSVSYYYNGQLAIGVITQKDFQDYEADVQYVEGFSTFLMTIRGIRVGFVVVELDDSIKLSLRSKGHINIREFAKTLGGGGHKNASGATLKPQDPYNVKKLLVKKMNSYFL